jgi:hypothetical protein
MPSQCDGIPGRQNPPTSDTFRGAVLAMVKNDRTDGRGLKVARSEDATAAPPDSTWRNGLGRR